MNYDVRDLFNLSISDLKDLKFQVAVDIAQVIEYKRNVEGQKENE